MVHRIQGNTLLTIIRLLQRIQMNCQVKRSMWWDPEESKVQELLALGVGVYHFPSTWMHSLTQHSSEPHCLKFLRKFHYLGLIWLNHWLLVINLIPSLSPLPRGQGWGWKSNPLLTRLVSMATSPHPDAIWVFQQLAILLT